MTKRPASGAALSEQLARAEADVERSRARVSMSVLALGDQIVRSRRNARRSAMSDKTEQLEAAIGEAAARIRPQVRDAGRRLSSWNDTVAGYVKERPGRCLLGALALGFVVGKLARRA